jgi:hypothetical protein
VKKYVIDNFFKNIKNVNFQKNVQKIVKQKKFQKVPKGSMKKFVPSMVAIYFNDSSFCDDNEKVKLLKQK